MDRRISERINSTYLPFTEIWSAMSNSLIAVYNTVGEAEAAVKALSDGGYPIKKVSLIAKDLHDNERCTPT